MGKTRIKLNICGIECAFSSDDSENYLRSIGNEVEQAIEDIVTNNERVSVTMAAILTALNCCDAAHKAASGADNLRSQIKDYLEDSARARTESEEARREIDRMRREIQTLRARLSGNSGDGAPQKAEPPKKPPAPPVHSDPAAPVQKPQTGNFSRVQPRPETEPDGFMSFFEKKTDEP